MPRETTTRITCDYKDKNGKPCGKTFLLHDDPKKIKTNVQDVVTTTDAWGNNLFFCGWLHLIAHGVAFIKATPPRQPNPSGLHVVKPTPAQIAALEQEGIIEKDEPVPPPDDLHIEEIE